MLIFFTYRWRITPTGYKEDCGGRAMFERVCEQAAGGEAAKDTHQRRAPKGKASKLRLSVQSTHWSLLAGYFSPGPELEVLHIPVIDCSHVFCFHKPLLV